MNSNKNDDSLVSALPKGWILCSSKSNPGRKYYFNRKTGKSSWTKPQDGESSTENQISKRKKEKEKEEIKNAMDDLLKVNRVPPKKNMKRKSDESGSQNLSHLQNKKKKEVIPPSKQKRQVNEKPKLTPIKRPNTSSSPRAPKRPNSTEKANSTANTTATSVSPVKRPYPSTNTSPACTSTSTVGSAKKVCIVSTKKSPGPTPPLKKNLAQDRMARLRADISNESIEDENSSKKSPNTSQNELKSGKVELKSPNLNDSKSTQSPNETIQSAASPSQFFAANKIICSMKAQLPEEYSHKEKQKDTFADIEQGIYNQVTEYPYMKHPATPPQFSEASKLVSAIKSKLSYKSKETPVKYNSANDRLNSLRRTLSSEAMDTSVDKTENTIQCSDEAMEVDLKETKQEVCTPNNVKDNVSSNENIVLVVDTNIFIHELDFIKKVMNSHIEGFSKPPTLLVPWRVVNELDKLKDSNNGNAAICKRARPALDYLYKCLPENDRIKVQPLRDANSHIYPCESPDDEILNCCLQQAERGKSVILVSNDKNLCIKAAANGVRHRGLRELRLRPTAEPPAAPEAAARVHRHMYKLLANILENEMRAKYDDIWERVVFSPPPWSLADVLQCLLKHWIAVFRDVFPRIEHLVTELKDAVATMERKESKNITQSELSNFKDLCLEVARHCQIIPEYMELAKKTVARLQRDGASESDDEPDQPDKDGDNVVVDVFEGVWTVFSSYCAKLATGLGISHSVDDKLPSDDTVAVLSSKLQLFGNHVAALTDAIGGILAENQSEQELEEQVSRLESAFKDSLGAIGVDGTPVNSSNLREFCTNCRIMLQEAHSKFSQLVELLQICKNNVELAS